MHHKEYCHYPMRTPSGLAYRLNGDRKEMEDGYLCSSKTFYDSHFACVSVKRTDEEVSIRDTKDATKQTLTFTTEEWKAFVEGVKLGEFDV